MGERPGESCKFAELPESCGFLVSHESPEKECFIPEETATKTSA